MILHLLGFCSDRLEVQSSWVNWGNSSVNLCWFLNFLTHHTEGYSKIVWAPNFVQKCTIDSKKVYEILIMNLKKFFSKTIPPIPPKAGQNWPPQGQNQPPPSWKQGKWHIKTTITQSTVGQFEPNFQWILRRHILISQCTYQDPTCPPRLQLLDLKDGWIPDGQITCWKRRNDLKFSPNDPRAI